MTITETTTSESGTTATAFVPWAAELGAKIAPFAAAHDRDGTFVTEAFDLFKSSGYLALAVPTELGGRGATIRQVAMAQRELAKHCGSSALAVSMHHHVTLFTAWRYRRGLPGAEATLRRIADEGIVLVSTGGADFTRPRGVAVPVDGGFRVSGRKVFASQVPVGDVFSTMFVLDDDDRRAGRPQHGRAGEGRRRHRARQLGHPRHARHRQPRRRDRRRVRPGGQGARPAPVRRRRRPAAGHHQQRLPGDRRPCTSASPRRRATPPSPLVAGTPRAEDPVDPAPGRVDGQPAAGDVVGARRRDRDDRRRPPAVDGERRGDDGRQARDLRSAGSRCATWRWRWPAAPAYFRTSPIERCYRDIRGAKFHPFTPEQTLVHAGRVCLGLPADEM